MATQYLSELEFDTQYRKAKGEFYYDGIIYFHKVKTDAGYYAEEAGIHTNPANDKSQFELDAFHGLAYLPAGEIPEQKEGGERYVDAIVKEGGYVETATDENATEEKPKKAAKQKAPKATEVKKVEKVAEVPSQELTEEKQQEQAGETIVSPLSAKPE